MEMHKILVDSLELTYTKTCWW